MFQIREVTHIKSNSIIWMIDCSQTVKYERELYKKFTAELFFKGFGSRVLFDIRKKSINQH